MNFIKRWKIRREFKKSAEAIEKICDTMPLSFYKNFLYDAKTNTPLEPIDALNSLYSLAQRMKRAI